jgi:hypothetical protein
MMAMTYEEWAVKQVSICQNIINDVLRVTASSKKDSVC